MVRLKDRMGLYMVALPESGAVPERVGLGTWMLTLGRVPLSAGLFHDDQLEARDPNRLLSCREWCEAFTIDTPIGPLGLSCTSLSEFNTGPFLRHGYYGRCAVVGADLGRTLGLMADWWGPAKRPEFRGGWSLGLRGWGVVSEREGRQRWSASYGRPWLFVQAVGSYGTRAAFGWPRKNPEGKRRGVWVTNANGNLSSFRGHFLDVVGSAFTFDGVESSELEDHLGAWNIDPVDATSAICVDPEGCERAIAIVQAVHRLAMAVDSEAARWG